MIIKKITVKRLRAIKGQKTLEFASGMNVIKGSDNEAGKSSLRIAITKALFQDPTSKKKEVEALTSWGTDEPWEVDLEFTANSDFFTIRKNFKDKTVELIGRGKHEFIAKNKENVAKKISELTGCPNETFFESTACIGQDEIIRLIPGNTSDSEKQNTLGWITRRLGSKLSGAEGMDLHGILSKLYKKTHYKDAEGPYFRLQDITERIGVLRSQKQEQESKNFDILEKRRKLAQSREELEKISPDLHTKQQLWQKNKRLTEIQKEIERDKELYHSFQRAKELKSQLDHINDKLRPLSSFNNSNDRQAKLDLFKRKLDESAQKSLETQKESELLKKHKPLLVVLLSGIAFIAGGLAGLLANPWTWIIAVAGAAACAYWSINWRLWRTQTQSVESKLATLDNECHNLEDEIRHLLKDFESQSYEEYVVSLTLYRNNTEAKRDTSNQLEALIAGKEWHVFAEERAELDIRISAGIQELEQLKSFKLEPLALQKLEQDITELSTRKSELETEKGALEQFFSYLDAERDQSAQIEESLSRLEEEKAFWENKKTIYDLTWEMLQVAYKQTLSKAADLLEEEISRYVDVITEGRYNQVELSESDLSIRTFSQLKNDWVEVEQLSRATQDQFYICARLALVKLITEGKSPPILLDDPFINFHPKRLHNMMNLLQEIAKDSQILLFTCSDSYDYLGKVISVG